MTKNNLNTLDTVETDSIDLASHGVPGFLAEEIATIDLQTMNNSSISLTSGQLGAVGQGYVYTGTGTGSGLNWQSPNTVWSTTSIPAGKPGTIELRGENADLVVNGKSLMRLLERMEDRLNLLEPNTELEKDWDDLRRLGERYRKLEKKCKEKAETWNKLKAMPPPTVD